MCKYFLIKNYEYFQTINYFSQVLTIQYEEEYNYQLTIIDKAYVMHIIL